jgi:hypothetical protein
MSALGAVAAGAGGVLAGQVWKVATVVLLGILLAGGGAGGALWWSAAAARDKALLDLKAVQGENVQLRAGVDDQNRAIQTWYRRMRRRVARLPSTKPPSTASASTRRCSSWPAPKRRRARTPCHT